MADFYLTQTGDEVQELLNTVDPTAQELASEIRERGSADDNLQEQINNLSADAYRKPQAGIPAIDLTLGVQESLANANASIAVVGDKSYTPDAFSGLGRVNLEKNIQTIGGVEKNILTQDMFYKGMPGQRVPNTNTIFVIQYDYDLNGEEITIPEGCVLKFDGGSLRNGTVKGQNTLIEGNTKCFEKDVIITGTWKNETIYTKWLDFVSTDDGVTDNSLCFKQLQSFINGSNGCKVEFEKGYYQTQIIGMEPEGYVEKDNITYPKWAMNTYQVDKRVVLNVLEVPYIDINLNGSTIKAINITCPGWDMIRLNGVTDGYVHDGTLIGMAMQGFTYPDYANYEWDISGKPHYQTPVSNYEFCELMHVCGGYVIVENLSTEHSTGDGIMIGSGGWCYREGDTRPDGTPIETGPLGWVVIDYPCKGYVVRNCEVSYCARNGMSLHSSNLATIKNCHIYNIGSDAGNGEIGSDGIKGQQPRAGIDVEFEDGQGLKPIMNWENLYIHNCGAKPFGFASPNYSRMKSFRCSNSTFIGLGVTNNMNADSAMEFDNCYFEYNNADGSLFANDVIYQNCEFILKKEYFLTGASTFVNCSIIDDIEDEVTTGVFGTSSRLGVFENCTITIKPGHLYGYLQNRTFRNCTLNFYAVKTLMADGAEFYNCVFNSDPDDESEYSFQFKRGNNYDLTRGTIKLIDCSIVKAAGIGGSASGSFMCTEDTPVYISNCHIGYLNIYHGRYAKNIKIENSNINKLIIQGYQQDIEGVTSIEINNCVIDTFRSWSNNLKEIILRNSQVKFQGSGGNIYNINLINCIVIHQLASSWGNRNIKGLGSTFDFVTTTNTSEFNLENCYIKGLVTEANFAGVKNACRFETSLPTSGTFANKPTTNVETGFRYFRTDGNYPIYYGDDDKWYNSEGVEVTA